VLGGEWVTHTVAVLDGEFDHFAHNQFETGDRATNARLREIKELYRGGGRGRADEGGFDRTRTRKHFHHCGSNDAERTFGADKDVAQVIAGIILFQLR